MNVRVCNSSRHNILIFFASHGWYIQIRRKKRKKRDIRRSDLVQSRMLVTQNLGALLFTKQSYKNYGMKN